MKKKVLYSASTASHILNFHLPYLQYFSEMGWQVDVAVGSSEKIPYTDNVIVLPFEKSLMGLGNIRAVLSMFKLLYKNHYDIVTAHTTLAGAVVRLALLLSGKRKSKVVYTSHGYFFNKKGKLSEWPYLLVEKILAPVTDVLMVMNRADLQLALRHRLGKKIVSIPGMGLDLNKFTKVESQDKRALKEEAGFYTGDFLIIYAAEMSKRKNQGELIRAFALAVKQEPSLKLLLAGEGEFKDEYMEVCQKLNLGDNIRFLGHVKDMSTLYNMCDIAVTTSLCEGLPFNVMEAMACGLPVIASSIKGHTDLLGGLESGFLYNLGDERALADKLLTLLHDETLRETVGIENKIKIQQYGLKVVKGEVLRGYSLIGERPQGLHGSQGKNSNWGSIGL